MSRLGLEETLLGGSLFRGPHVGILMERVIGKSVVELRFQRQVDWRTGNKHPFTEKKLRNYLWMGSGFAAAIDSLPWRSDPVLDRCMKKLPGLDFASTHG